MIQPMPSKNEEFATYCCDLLGAIGPCVLKRMFGGYGISLDGLTVAIMTDLGQGEKLWLKADDSTRAAFEAAGCQRFGYQRAGVARSMGYYSAPEDAMDSRELMAPWARLALQAALKAAAPTKAKTTRATKMTKATRETKTKSAALGKGKRGTTEVDGGPAGQSPATARPRATVKPQKTR